MEEQNISTIEKSNNSWKQYLSTKIEQKGILIVEVQGRKTIDTSNVAEIMQEWINTNDYNPQQEQNVQQAQKQIVNHEKQESLQGRQMQQNEYSSVKNIQVSNIDKQKQEYGNEKQVLLKIINNMFGQRALLDEVENYDNVRTIMKQYLRKTIANQQNQDQKGENKDRQADSLFGKSNQQEAYNGAGNQLQKQVKQNQRLLVQSNVQQKTNWSRQQVQQTQKRTLNKHQTRIRNKLQIQSNNLEYKIFQKEPKLESFKNYQQNDERSTHFVQISKQKQNQQKMSNSIVSQYRKEILVQKQEYSFNIRKSRNVSGSAKNNGMLNNSYISTVAPFSLQKNPYFEKMFKHLCRQNVSKGGRSPTFDQIAQSSNSMNLNKWMVFCKQFTFTQKLSKRQLINTFKNATNLKSEMSYEQFVHAVYVLQELIKVEPQTLIKDILQVNSQFAYRNKINNLKAQYFGPTKNFFEEITYKQSEKKIAQAFKFNQKKRRDGQMQKIRQKLKQKRQRQKSVVVKISPKVSDHREKSNYRKLVQQISSYSGIFKYKRQSTHSTQASSSFRLNKVVQQAKDQTKYKSVNNSMYHQPKSVDFQAQYLQIQSRSEMFSQVQQKRQSLPIIQMQSIEERLETYMIDSDAQSDQILKEHYKNQKKGNQNNAYSRLVQQIKLKTEQRDKGFFENQVVDHQQNQDDAATTYMITQYR